MLYCTASSEAKGDGLGYYTHKMAWKYGPKWTWYCKGQVLGSSTCWYKVATTGLTWPCL